MKEALEFVSRHGYLVLFAWVLAEQLGLPIPAIPVLVAAGLLAAAGRMNLLLALGLAVAAALLGDLVWFYLGRTRGGRVLGMLCRMSLEPDSCVRKTEMAFAAQGARSLVLAKFVPAFSTAAPPLAGIVGMRFSRFLFYDTLGAVLWAGGFAGLGYLFGEQIGGVLERGLELGSRLGWLLVGLLALYIGWKYWQRQRFIHELRISRITPSELKSRLDAGEEIAIVDLRHSLEFDGNTIARAIRMAPEEVEQKHDAIPRGREVVLFCT